MAGFWAEWIVRFANDRFPKLGEERHVRVLGSRHCSSPVTIPQPERRRHLRKVFRCDVLTAPRTPDFLAALLYYFGVLTLASPCITLCKLTFLC